MIKEADDLSIVTHNLAFVTPRADKSEWIEIHPPRRPNSFFAKDLDDLLTKDYAQTDPPDEFFIAELGTVTSTASPPIDQSLINYFAAITIIKTLKAASDYQDTSTGILRLVFLNIEILKIPVQYKAEDLVTLTQPSEILRMLEEDTHLEQRKTIFKQVISEELKNIEPNLQFAKILSRFDQITQKFHDNYKCYVSEFSFDKVFGEIETSKLEYVCKLNKILSEIQNQLLAIPIAIVLAVAQLEYKGHFTVKNLLIYGGTCIFSLIMFILIRNQYDNLQSIFEEITSQQTLLANKHPSFLARFEPIYKELKARKTRQQIFLFVIAAAIATTFIGTTILFVWYSGHFQFISAWIHAGKK